MSIVTLWSVFPNPVTYVYIRACMYVCVHLYCTLHMYCLAMFLNKAYRYTSRVAPSISNQIVEAARGWLNKLVPDVYIYTDLAKKKESKRYM